MSNLIATAPFPTKAREAVHGPRTLAGLLREQASRLGGERAYVYLADGIREESILSFESLDRQARAIARRLRVEGAAGGRALLLFPGGLDILPALFGCVYAGVVAVPAPPPDALRWKRTWPRLEAILSDSDASFVLTTTSILGSAREFEIPSARLDGLRWLDIREIVARRQPPKDDDRPLVEARPQDLAYLQYTSGSTTSPKGVEITHEAVLANCALIDSIMEYPPGSVSVTWMPYFHDYGLVHGLLMSLYKGICSYVLSPMTFVKRPERWLQAITRYRATHTQSPNFGYAHCVRRVDDEAKRGLDLSSLVVASNGAEPINPETIEAFAEAFAGCGFRREAMAPGYGLAENTLAVSSCQTPQGPVLASFSASALARGEVVVAGTEERDRRTLVGCGRAESEIDIAIVDPDRGSACPTGRVGEIWVRHASRGRGYWRKPEESRVTFEALLDGGPPYLRTGDLGFFHEGVLFIAGRLKDLIIVDGVNHHPHDIEWTVQGCHPNVRPGSVAAFSVEVEGRERLVVLAELSCPDPEEYPRLLAKIRAEVGQVHGLDPRSVVLTRSGQVVKTSSGKVSRAGCLAAFLDGSLEVLAASTSGPDEEAGKSPASPQAVELEATAGATPAGHDGLVAWMLRRVAERLGRLGDSVGPESELDRLGLTSRDLVGLTAELEDLVGRRLGASFLYERKTIRAVVEHLAVAGPSAGASADALTIAVAANFTAQPIEEPIRFWADTLGWPIRVKFAGYNQVFQELLDPEGLFSRNRGGVNVLMIRVEDWLRTAGDSPDPARLEAIVDEFLSLLRQAASRSPSPIVVLLAPHAPGVAADATLGPLVGRLDAAIAEAVGGLDGAMLIPADGLDRRYAVGSVFDPQNDRLGHIPYTSTFYTAMGSAIARAVAALKLRPLKVIAVDCDNTLWRGACGEDGPEGVELSPPFLALQEFLVARQREGFLLCLLSKNLESDVVEVFRRRPEMPLTLDRVVAHRINWEPKSTNLAGLAAELGLGVDSFVVLDDNPLECREIEAGCPGAIVLRVPSDPEAIPGWLEHLWVLDRPKVSAEDRARTEMVRQERSRGELRERSKTLDEFLEGLALVVEIGPLKPEDRARAAQLSKRTNQFNTTTTRFDEAELRTLEASGATILTARVRDRFGDYGLVGLAVIRPERGRLMVEALMMSCRVLGRRVEHALLGHIGREAERLGLPRVTVAFRPSNRNEPALRFLRGLGGSRPCDPCRQDEWFAYPTSELPELLRSRAEPPAESRAASGPAAHASILEAPAIRISSAAQQRIADEYTTAEAIRAASRSLRRPRPELASPFSTPRTPIQAEMAALWGELLGFDQIGIEDDFFDLGGDSLRAAELLARVRESMGVDLPIAMLESPTVSRLAEGVEALREGRPVSTAGTPWTLEAEARLDPSLVLSAVVDPAVLSFPPREIFFTGATGYLGAYLVHGLLEMTGARIHCLVRDGEIRRILDNLRFYDLWRDDAADRLVPVEGNLAHPGLGLTRPAFARLADLADSVYHCGAWVNFVFPYAMLKAPNVDGTSEIIRLAAEGRPKPLHFISTLGVLMSGGHATGQVLTEDGPLERSEGLPNGYEQTKWVADRLVQQARDRGLAASIYRPGMLTGDGRTGVYHKVDEFASSWIKGCIQLGGAPDVETELELVPIDYAARAIVAISLRRDALGKTYHMNHPRPIRNRELWDWVESYGYRLRRMGWETWKGELAGQARKRENALFPYFSFLVGLTESQAIMPAFDSANTRAALAGTSLRCPEMAECLDRYFDWFIRSGWMPAPPTRRPPAFASRRASAS